MKHFDLGKVLRDSEAIKSARSRRLGLEKSAKRSEELHIAQMQNYNQQRQLNDLKLAETQMNVQKDYDNIAMDELHGLYRQNPKMFDTSEGVQNAFGVIENTIQLPPNVVPMSQQFGQMAQQTGDDVAAVNMLKQSITDYGASLTKSQILKLRAGEKAVEVRSGKKGVVGKPELIAEGGTTATGGKPTDFDKTYAQEVAIAKELGLPVPTRKQLKQDMSSSGGLTEGSVLSSLDDFELMNDIPAGEAHKEYLRLRKDEGLERSEALVQAKENIVGATEEATNDPLGILPLLGE